jgi:hypothetical protein
MSPPSARRVAARLEEIIMADIRSLEIRCGLALALAGAVAAVSSCAAHVPTAAPVVPATTPHAPEGVNPFAGARLYGYPEFASRLDALASKTPAQAAALRKAATFPVAVWLDTIANAKRTSEWLDDALKQQTAAGQPVVPVFVVYDLPNRDCNAEASNGELSVKDGGEARYQKEYIDLIAAQFQAHASQRIVVVLEPDSLANIATNLGNDKCVTAEPVYRRAISYAIAKLRCPTCSSISTPPTPAGSAGRRTCRRASASTRTSSPPPAAPIASAASPSTCRTTIRSRSRAASAAIPATRRPTSCRT